MGNQFRTAAIVAKRHEPKDSLDYYPTPKWATRALFENVLLKNNLFKSDQTILEPSSGQNYMVDVLKEYTPNVTAWDIFDYGYQDRVTNYLTEDNFNYDWVITNPPFKHAHEFILKSIKHTNVGCAFLLRTAFLESKNRYTELFAKFGCSYFCQFVERVGMKKDIVSETAHSATAHAWFVWHKETNNSNLVWIPPCQDLLTKPGDYILKTNHHEQKIYEDFL